MPLIRLPALTGAKASQEAFAKRGVLENGCNCTHELASKKKQNS